MGRRSIKEQRRDEIVKAFYQVAKKEGLENTSIAKIAGKLGINPSLIIHYFKTREELLIALNDFILEQYLKIYSVDGSKIDSKEQLKQVIDNLFSRKWNRLFDDGVFYSCYAQIYRNSVFKRNFKDLHDMLHQKMKNTLDEAVENGVIEAENTRELAEHIYALVDGAYYYLGLVEDKELYNSRLQSYRKLALELLKLED